MSVPCCILGASHLQRMAGRIAAGLALESTAVVQALGEIAAQDLQADPDRMAAAAHLAACLARSALDASPSSSHGLQACRDFGTHIPAATPCSKPGSGRRFEHNNVEEGGTAGFTCPGRQEVVVPCKCDRLSNPCSPSCRFRKTGPHIKRLQHTATPLGSTA